MAAGVRISFRVKQSSQVCNAFHKNRHLRFQHWSHHDIHVIRYSALHVWTFHCEERSTNVVELRKKKAIDYEYHSEHNEEKQLQEAGSREQKWEWGEMREKSKWCSAENKYGKKTTFPQIYFPSCRFIITKPPSLTHASSLPLIPSEPCRKAFILILIKASGSVFHP